MLIKYLGGIAVFVNSLGAVCGRSRIVARVMMKEN